MRKDDAKKAILARRARFIAAAVATSGLGGALGCDKAAPQGGVVSSAPGTTATSSEAAPPTPAVCLTVSTSSPATPKPDAGPSPSRPRVCLSYSPDSF